MDETIKLYTPRQNRIKYEMLDDIIEEVKNEESKGGKTNKKKEIKLHRSRNDNSTSTKSKWKSRLNSLCEVLVEHEKWISRMTYKHSWFNLVYNWVIWILLAALILSTVFYTIQWQKDRKEQAIRATAYAEWTAEEEAKKKAEKEQQESLEAIEKASEEYTVNRMTTALSKMYYGIKNFETKYHYKELDFKTYGRCGWDRLLSGKYSDRELRDYENFEKILFQEDQFLSCYENNPDVEPYHTMANNHIKEWRAEKVAPVSNDFIYAELTENGVYLRNVYKADGYARRWCYTY